MAAPEDDKQKASTEADFFDLAQQQAPVQKDPSIPGGHELEAEEKGMPAGPEDILFSGNTDSQTDDAKSAGETESASKGSSAQSAASKVSGFGTGAGSVKALAILDQYLIIASKLLMSPRVFFNEMEVAGGIAQPAIFLVISSLANALLASVFSGFHFWNLPSRFVFESIAVVFLSGVSFMLAKSMGSKSSFEAVFKVFAYCSCLNVFGAIPGVGLLTPIYGLVLNYLGLRIVLQSTVQQTITVLAFALLMQLVLNVGRVLSGH